MRRWIGGKKCPPQMKKGSLLRDCPSVLQFCGEYRARTDDLMLAKHALFQLS